MKGDENLLVGLDTSDDAGVYRISRDVALVQTLDFLTPVTDDPYEFGLIAAANSLSDIYAMGATPVTVMNIVCFPGETLAEEILEKTLQGGLDKINESGATLVGGHSVEDAEFKYGLSVTGTVRPDRITTNKGIRKGDALILTKPVGTGIAATAIKAELCGSDTSRRIVSVMAQLNRYAAEIMGRYRVSAATDVTGFGLAGHFLEMARASGRDIMLDSGRIPVIEGVEEFASMGLVPAGAHKNRSFFGSGVRFGANVSRLFQDIVFDPQTSGGLVISMDNRDAKECVTEMETAGIEARIIGEVKGAESCGGLLVE